MPERLPYDEAMLFSSVRLKVQDPEIKQGKVATIKVQTKLGMVERPWGVEGGFAVVYKFRTRSGRFRALRCFRVPMEADTQFRYEQIEPYFHAHVNSITAGFKYYDCGIVVKEQGQAQTYPLIEMDWIDGVTLVDKVDELCQKRDRATLRNLSEQWISIMRTLHKAKIAHGDLAGPNIMVRSDGQMILIDYDGVYIPPFAGKPLVLLGQPDYQHPQMGKRVFDEHMDAFSALVIYTALLALSLHPELWNTYTARDKGKLLDTNLMFVQKDFQNPQNSPLFHALEHLGDARIKQLVQELKRACASPIEQVRFPFQLLDDEYEKKQALELLKQALIADDDEQIIKLWTPELAKYQGAQSQRIRVQLAQQRVKALTQWRSGLKNGSIAQIVSSYDSVLDQCKSMTQSEQDLLVQARKFLHLYNSNDDDALLMVTDALDRLRSVSNITFTHQEQQRITHARQRKKDEQQVKTALQSRTISMIAASYASFQRIQHLLSQQDCQVVELAHNFSQAYNRNDDNALLATFDAIQQSAYYRQLQPSKEQVQRIEQARHRKEVLACLRTALASKNLVSITAAYDPVLDDSKEITAEERSHITLARMFSAAVKDQNDDDLVNTYASIQNSSPHNWLIFTQEEEQRVEQARQRRVILEQFRMAVKSKQPRRIAAVYYNKDNHSVLTTSKGIPAAQRELAQLARDFTESFNMRDDERLLATYEALQLSSYKDALDFTQEEQRSLQEICARKAALTNFVQTLHAGSPEDIATAYQKLPAEVHTQLSTDQLNKAKSAVTYLDQYQRLQEAIQAKNGKEVRRLYRRIENHPLLHLAPDEQRSIDGMMKAEKVDISLKQMKDRQALKDARELQQMGGNGLDEFRLQLSGATRRLIKTCELEHVTAVIRSERSGHFLVVSWRWPEEEQVRDALIIYSPYQIPPEFQELQEVNYPCKYVMRRVHERDKQEEFLLDRRYTALYLRVCALMRDDWEHPGARIRDGQYKYYLSPGITGQAHLPGNMASRRG